MKSPKNNYSENGVHEIRPRVLFELIEKKFQKENPSFVVNIPPTEVGGLTLLEHSILVSLLKLTDPKEIFEFGTYMGASTFVLSVNSNKATKIVTLDIPADEIDINENYSQDRADLENDNFLRDQFVNKGAVFVDQASEDVKSKVTQIYANSLTLDLEGLNLLNRFDLIFIDGGHDYATIKSDTEKALRMAKKDAIIAWHDYKTTLHTNVTDFINDFAKENAVFHVHPSMIAFTLLGSRKNLIV